MEKFWISELREARGESPKESRDLVLDFTATTINVNMNYNKKHKTYKELGGLLEDVRIAYSFKRAMDNLTLSYDGNRVTGVSETAADYDFFGSYKGANGSQYLYDANGSLVADKSRGIAYVTYDASNNPGAIYFTNGSVTKYAYDSSGQKLRVTHHTAKPNITRTFGVMPPELTPAQTLSADTTDYLLGGSLVATNGTVDKILFDGGFADVSSSGSFVLFYYNKDHLGNNREALIRSGSVLQVTRYYPVALRRLFLAMAELKQVSLCSFGLAKKFGAQYAGSTEISGVNIQPYKYNGKELDRMHGLDTYDYGARQYNPITARWDRVDPLCEKYYSVSPYAYCEDNPINAIDDKGDSTCVLNYGSGSNQHLAMLIQNDEVKWSYFSFNGIKIFNSTSGISGGAPHNNLGERSFDSPTVFLNSIYNSDGSYEEIELA